MKRGALVLAAVMFFLVAAPQETLAQQQTELRLFVEASIGVDVDAPDEVTLNLGERDGFFMTIINEGNIRDRIRVEGILRPKNEWVDFSFTCTGGLGDCDSTLDSEPHRIDNLELTPEINSTTVFVEIVGWRKTNTFAAKDKPVLALTGFSLTNATKQSLKGIDIVVEDPDAGFGPLAAPGLNDYAAAMLIGLSGLVAYRRKDLV